MPRALTVPLTLEINTSPRFTSLGDQFVANGAAGVQASPIELAAIEMAAALVAPNTPSRTIERTVPTKGNPPILLRREVFIDGTLILAVRFVTSCADWDRYRTAATFAGT